MSIINIILLIIILMEGLILFFYLFNNKTKGEIRIDLIICIIILIMTLIIYYRKDFIFSNIISLNDYILFIVVFFTVIILRLVYYNQGIENKYNKSIKNIMEYEKIIDEQGKKNHEYKNQLIVLRGYINNKKKLEEYLNTIIEDHRDGQNYEIKQLTNFPNGGLKEMIYYKIMTIKEYNIKYYLYVSEEATDYLEKLDVKTYKDVTKVFGVLIDNAIDSANKSVDKEISLDFSIDSNYIIITVSNSYNKDIDLNKIGKKGFSSKGKGHGFGLRLAKEIVKKNKKFELSTDYDDKCFEQTFLIDTK